MRNRSRRPPWMQPIWLILIQVVVALYACALLYEAIQNGVEYAFSLDNLLWYLRSIPYSLGFVALAEILRRLSGGD